MKDVQMQHKLPLKKLSSRIVETQVAVPRKVKKQKSVIEPEEIYSEETIEELQTIREKIIEVAKVIQCEKIVEVPEIFHVEKIVEVPQIEYVERVKHVPKKVVKEVIHEVPRRIIQEREVFIPETEYVSVPRDKVVKVPEYRDRVVYKDVQKPRYVKKPYDVQVDVDEDMEVQRIVPLPVEAVTECVFELATIKPKYKRKELALYAPRFVEIPIPADLMDPEAIEVALFQREQVHRLAAQDAPSLIEIEKVAQFAKTLDLKCADQTPHSYHKAIHNAWSQKKLAIQKPC